MVRGGGRGRRGAGFSLAVARTAGGRYYAEARDRRGALWAAGCGDTAAEALAYARRELARVLALPRVAA